jgi:hypothetical protein
VDFVAATAIFSGLADLQVDRELYNEMLADYIVQNEKVIVDIVNDSLWSLRSLSQLAPYNELKKC